MTKFSDSTALIVKHEKGSNFSKGIDSVCKAFVPSIDSAHYIASLTYDFDDAYDYNLLFLPSLETHKVSQIKYGDEKYKYGLLGGSADYEVCSCGYNIDGKDYHKDAYMSSESAGVSYAIQVE